MAGTLEITDANDYYPFGMNHLKTGNAYFAKGSYKNNKYNGKELQETGIYSYGWREYMPDIGRWNGIDQLAENYLSTSTYAYVANNPVSYADVDGRWFDQDGHITDTSGQTFGFLDSSVKPKYATNFLGVNPGDGSGSGGSAQALIDRASGLGGSWTNTGYGFQNDSNIALGYDGSYTSLNTELDGYINIPEVTLSGSNFFWGAQAQSGFNSYMGRWNTKSDFAWDRTSNAGRYADGGVMMIGGHGDLLGLYDIGGQMMSTWKPENRYLAMGVGLLATFTLKKPGLAAMGEYEMTSTAVRSALTNRIGKRGFSEVGYQFSKHAGREVNGALWKTAMSAGTKNPAAFNEAGYKIFKEIWKAPGSFKTINGFIEKRLPDGRGIRFQENWQFKGFLD